jgi:DNA-directed RNA polymerase subunit K/omega
VSNDRTGAPGIGAASKYELVIVAAREARRLNDFYRHSLATPPRRVTLEAVDRVMTGQVKYKFAPDEEAPI